MFVILLYEIACVISLTSQSRLYHVVFTVILYSASKPPNSASKPPPNSVSKPPNSASKPPNSAS